MPETPPPASNKPPCDRDDAIAVVKRLREAGHVAYFAGGCVRDELLGIRPKDFDVATDAPPQRVRELFSNTQAVGAAFGVILVRHRKSVVEVATFRSDGTYLDGRHPSNVHFTNAEEDAKRRDFTINGLFLDPLTNHVIDYVGGQHDLKARVLRAIGEPNHRFDEDHLRLVRAVRFAARFDLQIDPATEQAIIKRASHLQRISPERIAEELRAILVPASRTKAWRMLGDYGLLPVILRHLPEKSLWPPFSDRGHSPVFPNLAEPPSIGFGLALAALVLCYRSSSSSQSIQSWLEPREIRRAVQACRTSLKISNDEADEMSESLNVAHLLRDDPPGVAAIKRFLARPHASEARQLLRALRSSDYELAPRIEWLENQFEGVPPADIAPPPLITGDDLTSAGLQPGKLFKRILEDVYDAQLEDRVTSKKQAMELAMKIAKTG